MSTTINELNEYIQDKLHMELPNPGEVGCSHINKQNTLQLVGNIFYPIKDTKHIEMYLMFCSNCGLILRRQ